MKIAITGKGGVGKTTLAAMLSYLYVRAGRRVIAVDADPDANLASALGLSQSQIKDIKPIAEMSELIEQRTGSKPGSMGGVFKLNPRVDDIPEACSIDINGIKLLVMGKSKEASSGCYCPENVFLKRLLRHIVLDPDMVVIVDMEAGIEHLTRGTAEAVDAFVVVVEPGSRSLQTARTIKEMAKTLGVKNVFVAASKIRDAADLDFIKENIEGMKLIGHISFSPDIVRADINAAPPFLHAPSAVTEAEMIKKSIEEAIER
ncbi:carbon monoxide dehydrogenase accessory protein CooC [Candidatus Magnetominusculus xianensis]|uniref:Carbon monoxide dehydrogenase n=1 Tax=Candidatus Magnetominusculus xianensis TaxID=1748249 RepID=A0ABR5SDW4_9BACT|nr:carbon monoxide dehydrogenase accessory protein CooC [Candidatus Magnetominusculus xianensis]KWT83485.1 carbon monoxide dehydrogenase [Candidatus Magnetominusculus xianensis]MBF0404125.1 AAA family ATPase [Nitrospirota bacterium]